MEFSDEAKVSSKNSGNVPTFVFEPVESQKLDLNRLQQESSKADKKDAKTSVDEFLSKRTTQKQEEQSKQLSH